MRENKNTQKAKDLRPIDSAGEPPKLFVNKNFKDTKYDEVNDEKLLETIYEECKEYVSQFTEFKGNQATDHYAFKFMLLEIARLRNELEEVKGFLGI